MSFVATYVARHEISLEVVYGKQLRDGSAYWVHEKPNECWFTKDGEWVGEAMSDEVDWERSSKVYDLRYEHDDFLYLWRDPVRDRALGRLRATKERLEKAHSKLRSRDSKQTWAQMEKLGYGPDSEREAPEGLYESVAVKGEDTKAAREKVDQAAGKIFAFHQKYILSRRVPIALGIYGST